MDQFWIVVAAIVGGAASIIVSDLGQSLSWRTIIQAAIPAAVNAAAWALNQTFGAEILALNLVLAFIGAWGLSSLVSYGTAVKAIQGQLKAMQSTGSGPGKSPS